MSKELQIHELAESFVNEKRFNECSVKTKSSLYRGFYDGYETSQSRIVELESENAEMYATFFEINQVIKSFNGKILIETGSYLANKIKQALKGKEAKE